MSGSFYPDPADRIIVATGIVSETPLLTRDNKILNYKAEGFSLVTE